MPILQSSSLPPHRSRLAAPAAATPLLLSLLFLLLSPSLVLVAPALALPLRLRALQLQTTSAPPAANVSGVINSTGTDEANQPSITNRGGNSTSTNTGSEQSDHRVGGSWSVGTTAVFLGILLPILAFCIVMLMLKRDRLKDMREEMLAKRAGGVKAYTVKYSDTGVILVPPPPPAPTTQPQPIGVEPPATKAIARASPSAVAIDVGVGRQESQLESKSEYKSFADPSPTQLGVGLPGARPTFTSIFAIGQPGLGGGHGSQSAPTPHAHPASSSLVPRPSRSPESRVTYSMREI